MDLRIMVKFFHPPISALINGGTRSMELRSHLVKIGRALPLAIVVLLIQSLFWTDRVPLVFKIATGALAVLAFMRPGEALLVVAGLVPFGHALTTRVWDAYPLALAEAMVLAFLAGYLTRTWRPGDTARTQPDPLSTPARLFALVVLASCAVQFVVVRVWHDYPLAYSATFLAYLARDYVTTVPDPRPWVEGHGFVTTAALLIEGVALLLVVRRLCQEQPGLARRVTRVVVLAGAGAAVINLLEVVEVALSGEPVLYSPTLGYRRWALFIPSLNTSGSYFVLVAFVAFGLAASARPHPWWIGAGVLAVGAMWLTRTRSALVTGFATAAAALVWLSVLRARLIRPRGAAAIAAAVALVLSVSILAMNPWPLFRSDAYPWLSRRMLLAQTAARMLMAHPYFGVGVAQYTLCFPDFSSANLLEVHTRADAHNYFLWIAAEFGLVGFAAFAWLLGAPLARAWRQLRANPFDLWLAGLCGGLVSFVLTWLSGQPLAVPEVAYTFWIVLGLAVGVSDGPVSKGSAKRSDVGQSKWKRGAIATLVAFILVSVPIRARQAIDRIDLARVTYGLYLWETEETGIRYRWSGSRATLFARSSVRAIDLPLRAGLDPTRSGADAFEVKIFVNRRLANWLRLTDDDWYRVRVLAPREATRDRFWRIDLRVAPTWYPRVVLPDSTDLRKLGVKVGQIATIEH